METIQTPHAYARCFIVRFQHKISFQTCTLRSTTWDLRHSHWKNTYCTPQCIPCRLRCGLNHDSSVLASVYKYVVNNCIHTVDKQPTTQQGGMTSMFVQTMYFHSPVRHSIDMEFLYKKDSCWNITVLKQSISEK